MADTMQTTTASPIRGTSEPVPPADRRDERANGGAIADAKEMGSEVVAAVREGATSLFEEQRNRAADEIAALSETLRRSAQSLDSSGTVARYADDAARQLGDFASTLRNRSWNEMVGDVEDFARGWPIAFMAAAVGIGFVAGRFLMASAAWPADGGQAGGVATRPGGVPLPTTRAGIGGTAVETVRSGYGATASRENG